MTQRIFNTLRLALCNVAVDNQKHKRDIINKVMDNDQETPVQFDFDLSPIQVRVLGAMVEKKETTPDQYPLTVNSLRNACNQKTARYPVTAYTEGEIGHTLRELQEQGLLKEAWGARVAKYEHRVDKEWKLYSRSLALVCVLMLRGPQTLGELRGHSQRLFEFDDLEDVRLVLDKLIEHGFAVALPRQPGQKEGRFAHLLCGEPQVPEANTPASAYSRGQGRADQGDSELLERIEALEARLAAVEEQLARDED
jgi:uncharacterized protein YceH (UPF0502 family)